MSRKPKDKGFSLAEVIIAAFVFITTVAGVLSVWSAHAKGISKARMTLVANELGEQIMEECIAARFQHVDQFHQPDPLANPPIEIDFIVKDRQIFAKYYTAVTVTEIVPDFIKEVKVSVQWTDSTNQKDANDRSSIDLVTELHSSD